MESYGCTAVWASAVQHALYLLLRSRKESGEPRFDRLAVLMYLTVGLANIVPLLIAGIGDLGLIGLFVMIPWTVAGWMTTDRKRISG